MMQPPPAYIANTVHRFAPGFWQEFIYRANSALAGLAVTGTSWYRAPDYNASVGGLVDSQHILGTAFDIAGPDAMRAAEQLRRWGFEVYTYPTHVHAQAWPAGVARAAGVFTAIGL